MNYKPFDGDDLAFLKNLCGSLDRRGRNNIVIVAHHILLGIASIHCWLEDNESLSGKSSTLHSTDKFLGLAREHRSAHHFNSSGLV